MQRRLILSLVILGVLVVSLWWMTSVGDPGAVDASRRTQEHSTREPANLVPSPLVAGKVSAELRQAAEESDVPPGPIGESSSDSTPGPLFGRLVHARTLEPLREIRVIVTQPPAPSVERLTGDDRRFEMPPFQREKLVLVVTKPPWGGGTLWPEPTRFLPSNETGEEVVFHLDLPIGGFEINVEVVRPDGKPAVGAHVGLSVRFEEPDEAHRNRWPKGVTGADGRIRFLLYTEEARARCSLEAWLDPDLMSEPVRLEPLSAPGVLRMQLVIAGRLLGRVFGPRGEGVQGARVRVVDAAEGGVLPDRLQGTNARGEARIPLLPAGTYVVRVAPPGGEWSRVGTAEIVPGIETIFEWTIEELEELAPLAVRGRVLDQNGAPLADITVGIRGGGETSNRMTDVDGRFSHRMPTCDFLEVCVDPMGDAYDPPVLEIPFGTTDVTFRRTATREKRSLTLRVVDRVSGDPVSEFGVLTYIAWPRWHGPDWSGRHGLANVTEKVSPGMGAVVRAKGYLHAEFVLEEALSSSDGSEPYLIELARGFRFELEVHDCETGEPIPGALFRAPNAADAVADELGRVLLEAATWPAVYRVEAAGYYAEEFEPARECVWADDGWNAASSLLYLLPR